MDDAQAPSPIPDNWRQWAVEAIMLHYPLDALKQTLRDAGFSDVAIEAELKLHQNNPYIEAARVIANRLHRREWVSHAMNYMRKRRKDAASIPVLPVLPFQEFLQHYYYRNEPCVLKEAASHWPCVQEWNWETLEQKIGRDTMVQVQLNRESATREALEAGSGHTDMAFGAYMKKLRALTNEGSKSNDFYITAGNSEANKTAFAPLYEGFGQIGDGYLRANVDVFRDTARIWVGPKGSVTGSHFDTVNVLVVQVLGRKRFILSPATDAVYMSNHKFYYSDVDVLNPDLKKFPDYGSAVMYDITIGPGDAIFIPAGWWHAVSGIDHSVSVSLMNFSVPNYEELPPLNFV